MSKGCYQAAWGLLIILLDFRIQGFDILPDVIGFVLLIAGLHRLKTDNEYFRIGYVGAWVLAGAACMQFLMMLGQPAAQGLAQPAGMDPMNVGLQIVSIICQLVLVYGICKGIEARALRLKQTALQQSARVRLAFYITVNLIWLIVLPFAYNISQDTAIPLMFVFTLGMIICTLSVMLLCRSAGRLWREHTGNYTNLY